MSEEMTSFADNSASEIGDDLRQAIEQLQAVPAMIWNGGPPRPSTTSNINSSVLTPANSCSIESNGSDTVFYDNTLIGVNRIKTSEEHRNTASDLRYMRTFNSYQGNLNEEIKSSQTTNIFNEYIPGDDISFGHSDITSLTNSLDRAIKANFPNREHHAAVLQNSECDEISHTSEICTAAPQKVSCSLDFKVRKVHKHALPQNLVQYTTVAEKSSIQMNSKKLQRDVYEEAMKILDNESIRTNHRKSIVRCESPEILVEEILEGIGSNDCTADERSNVADNADYNYPDSSLQCNGFNLLLENKSDFQLISPKMASNIGHQTVDKIETVRHSLQQSESLLKQQKPCSNIPASSPGSTPFNLKNLSENLNSPSMPQRCTNEFSPHIAEAYPVILNQQVYQLEPTSIKMSRFAREKSPEEIFEEIVESLGVDDDYGDFTLSTESQFSTVSDLVTEPPSLLSFANQKPTDKVAKQIRTELVQPQKYECEIRDYSIENENLSFYYSQARVEKTTVKAQNESSPDGMTEEIYNEKEFLKSQKLRNVSKRSLGTTQYNKGECEVTHSHISQVSNDKESSIKFEDIFRPRGSCSEAELKEPADSCTPIITCTHIGSCELIYTNEPNSSPEPISLSILNDLSESVDTTNTLNTSDDHDSSLPRFTTAEINSFSIDVNCIQNTDRYSSNVISHVPENHKVSNKCEDFNKPKIFPKPKRFNKTRMAGNSEYSVELDHSNGQSCSELNGAKHQEVGDGTTSVQQKSEPHVIEHHDDGAVGQNVTSDWQDGCKKFKNVREHNFYLSEHKSCNSEKSTNKSNIKDLKESTSSIRIESDASNDGLNLNIDKEFFKNVEACTNSDIDGGSLDNLLCQNDDALWPPVVNRITPKQLRKRLTRTSRVYQASIDGDPGETVSYPLDIVSATKKTNDIELVNCFTAQVETNQNSLCTLSDQFDSANVNIMSVPYEITSKVEHSCSKSSSNINKNFEKNLEILLGDLSKERMLVTENEKYFIDRETLTVGKKHIDQNLIPSLQSSPSSDDITCHCNHSNVLFEQSNLDQVSDCTILDEYTLKFVPPRNSTQSPKESTDTVEVLSNNTNNTFVRDIPNDVLNTIHEEYMAVQNHSPDSFDSFSLTNVEALNNFQNITELSKCTTLARDVSDTLGTTIAQSTDLGEKVAQKKSIIPGAQVLSEEVIVQKIVLNISWPRGKRCPNPRRRSKASKTDVSIVRKPFRELQLQRLIRMSDWDIEDAKLEHVGSSEECSVKHHPPTTASQSLSFKTLDRTLSIKDKYISRNMCQENDKCSVSLVRQDGKRLPDVEQNEEFNISEKSESYTPINSEKTDTVSVVDVARDETVQLMHVPADTIYRVPSLKHVVEAVSQTFFDDTQLLPGDSNIRIICDAKECRTKPENLNTHYSPEVCVELDSASSSNVTVIRREIFDKIRLQTCPVEVFPVEVFPSSK